MGFWPVRCTPKTHFLHSLHTNCATLWCMRVLRIDPSRQVSMEAARVGLQSHIWCPNHPNSFENRWKPRFWDVDPGNWHENSYENSLYLRVEVKDKPGVLSSITNILAKNNISVQRLIQIPDNKKKTASIVIITHKSNEYDAQSCIKSFKFNKNILKKPTLIRLFN